MALKCTNVYLGSGKFFCWLKILKVFLYCVIFYDAVLYNGFFTITFLNDVFTMTFYNGVLWIMLLFRGTNNLNGTCFTESECSDRVS